LSLRGRAMLIDDINRIGPRVMLKLDLLMRAELLADVGYVTPEMLSALAFTVGANIFMNLAGCDRAEAIKLATEMLSLEFLEIPN
jgi:hypothetical protein